MILVNAEQADVIAFGEFRLFPVARLVERDGVPLPLNGRALHILIVLAQRAGEVVTKQELLALVWPDVTVEEGSLRFHMVALRKALGEGREGARFVTTVPGRGYCFVAPVTRPATIAAPVAGGEDAHPSPTLPGRFDRMIGRDGSVAEVLALFTEHRLVNITGPGGIGKTTVAIAVAHAFQSARSGAVHFVDLATVGDPGLVLSVTAAAMGLKIQSHDIASRIIAHLRDHPMLLIFDNCEHVINAVADIAERILAETLGVTVLATSREALRIEGEIAYRLPALQSPPDGSTTTIAEIMGYPATRLFIERSGANGGAFEFGDGDAPLVADICRKLDGMALAIELAASRVEVFGLRELADMLGGRIRLLWRGRRTAPARQHTLSATLDWSCNLLSETERQVLNRFSVFVGVCTLDAVRAVIADEDLDGSEVLETVAHLVDKSLITSQVVPSGRRLYLLQTTRSYLRARARFDHDNRAVARRHAEYFRDLLSSFGEATAPTARGYALYGEHLGNVRGALEWTFSADGDATLGVSLAANTARMFQELSLLDECETWCRRALATLNTVTSGSRNEMELQAAHGLSMMFTQGNGDEVRQALTRAIDLAHIWDEGHSELQTLGRLITFETRISKFDAAVATARRSEIVARKLGDPAAMAMAGWMLGASLHGAGDQKAALSYCETAVGDAPRSARIETQQLSSYYQLRALNGLGCCLWLRGQTRRALSAIKGGEVFAADLNDPLAANVNAMYAAPVFLWTGEWDAAEEQIEWQIPHAEKHGWAPHRAVGLGLRGVLQIRRGEPELGISTLTASLDRLQAERHYIWLGTLLSALAEGFLATGRIEEAGRVVEKAIGQFERDGETWFTAEVFRVGSRVAMARGGGGKRAEVLLGRALEISRRQGSLSWELRAASDLASIWHGRGEPHDGIALLRPLYDQYAQADATPDLRVAARLLDAMGWSPPCGAKAGLDDLVTARNASRQSFTLS